MQKKDQWSSTLKHDVTWDIKCSEIHKEKEAFEPTYPCVLWLIRQPWGIFAASISSSPWLLFFFLCLIPSFTSFPPSLPWTQNALSLFPAAFEPRSEGTFWLAHIHIHSAAARSGATDCLPFWSPVSLSLYLNLSLSSKANGNKSITGYFSYSCMF